MNKRMLSLFLATVLLVSLLSGITFTANALETYSGGSGTETDPYLLSSAEDMLALHTALSNDDGSLDAADECGLGAYHGYYFKLTADIDMTGVEWTPVSFCGNLDGAGYAIQNLSVTEAFDGDKSYWAAMFAQLINATVSNITFENCAASISAETSATRDVYVAIVAANAIASKLENITVVDSFVTQNGSAKNFGYAAFVAAIADISNITGCVVEGGAIHVTADSTSMLTGGITGCLEDLFWEYIADYGNPYNMAIGAGSDYGIFDCYVNADITANAGGASHTAGIVGMTCTDYLDKTEEFSGVAVVIKNCVYRGFIYATKGGASGISGWDEPEDQLIGCVSLATLSAPRVNVLGELPEMVANSYYLSETANEQGGRTKAQVIDGTVCTDRGEHFLVDGTCKLCTLFAINLSASENGAVYVKPLASEGESVAITAVSAEGYVLNTISVTDINGQEISVNDHKFTMPKNSVTVSATFKANPVLTIDSIVLSYQDNEDGTVNPDSVWLDIGYTASGIERFSIVLLPEGTGDDALSIMLNNLYMGQEDILDGTLGFAVDKSKFTEGTTYTLKLTATTETNAVKNFVYSAPELPTVDYDITLATVDGAQMRLSEPQGLRFTSTIAKSGDFSAVKEYGTILIPTENLTNAEDLVIDAELDGRTVAKVPAIYRYAEDEETVTFTAVITNIAEKNYARSYTARAYAILEDGTVVYGGTYTSRSIYQVAKLVLESDTATDAEIEAAQAIVNVVEKYGDNDAPCPWN